MISTDVRISTAAALAVVLCLAGCKKSQATSSEEGAKSSSSSETASAGGSGSAGSTEGETSGDEADSPRAKAGENDSAAPPKDLYPGMKFGQLSAEERTTFVSVVKMELCPCQNSDESLHACLKRKGGTCAAARRMASIVVAGIKRGRGLTDIRSKLAEFAEALEKTYEFDLSQAPHRGPTDAPVAIVEFADFQCPHCKRMAGVMRKIHKKFGDKVVHYFKHFPLRAHGKAGLAARAAVAAGEQGKFWPMHDLLFEHQSDLSQKTILRLARRIGLNVEKFKRDLKSRGTLKVVQSDKQEGAESGVEGTPTLFINGKRYIGSESFDALAEAIRSRLKTAEKGGGKGNGKGGSEEGSRGESE